MQLQKTQNGTYHQSDKIKAVKHKANNIQTRCTDSSSDNDDIGLVVNHVLSADVMPKSTEKWIVDSGATCHICNNRSLFVELYPVKTPIDITLGDGRALKAAARGVVNLRMKYGRGTCKCKLYDVLYVPDVLQSFKCVKSS